MSDHVSIVVTTIFSPNNALRALAQGAANNKWEFIVVGDEATPPDFQLNGARYFNLHDQQQLPFRFAKVCPIKHYTRKNIGYLIAAQDGASTIVETDDDNIPNIEFWSARELTRKCSLVKGTGWKNIYQLYADTLVWPRGFPLEFVQSNSESIQTEGTTTAMCPVQQGLADSNPDVDAVYRMVHPLPLNFKRSGAHLLRKGAWTPFNSQNTTWFRQSFPLMYLPSFCTFRMTDIWRSLVAQRVMWECDWGLLFDDASVYQDRNEHDLLKDFQQEIPGYLNNNRIKTILEDLPLKHGESEIADNMMVCYNALVTNKIISSPDELKLLEAFLQDLADIKDARKDR